MKTTSAQRMARKRERDSANGGCKTCGVPLRKHELTGVVRGTGQPVTSQSPHTGSAPPFTPNRYCPHCSSSGAARKAASRERKSSTRVSHTR